MRRKHGNPFSASEIVLLSDLTKSSKTLAVELGTSESLVGKYRRDVLGIHISGLIYDFKTLHIDWDRDPLIIASELKVGVTTVQKWQKKLRKKLLAGSRMNAEHMQLIIQSSECSAAIGKLLNIPASTVRYTRLKCGIKRKAGRRKFTLDDFDSSFNWRQPVTKIAQQLQISRPTADRLKAAALAKMPRDNSIQSLLPGFESLNMLPSDFPDVDWTENTSVLVANLKLDRASILRLKSLAGQSRRRAKNHEKN